MTTPRTMINGHPGAVMSDQATMCSISPPMSDIASWSSGPMSTVSIGDHWRIIIIMIYIWFTFMVKQNNKQTQINMSSPVSDRQDKC